MPGCSGIAQRHKKTSSVPCGTEDVVVQRARTKSSEKQKRRFSIPDGRKDAFVTEHFFVLQNGI